MGTVTNSLIKNNRNSNQQADPKMGSVSNSLIQIMGTVTNSLIPNHRTVTNSLIQNNGNSNQQLDPK
jgi:hypothetical protein